MNGFVINIGNTNIRFGIVRDNDFVHSWVINTKPHRTADEFVLYFENFFRNDVEFSKKIDKVVIGSVVPMLTQEIVNASNYFFQKPVIVVDRNTPSKVSHSSKQMGTDIYANAVSGFERFHAPVLVFDLGTALTCIAVDRNGHSLGALIAPGIITGLKSLVANTAQLQEVSLEVPKSILGFTTESCMQSGLMWGYASMIEGLKTKIEEEQTCKFFSVCTGGMCTKLSPILKNIDVIDELHTLKGLWILGNQ